MRLGDILTRLASATGITERDKLLALFNDAYQEVWSVVDLPDTLDVLVANPDSVTSDGEGVELFLPYYVQYIRGVRRHLGEPLELTTRARVFQHNRGTRVHWELTRRTPLSRRVTNATQLEIRRLVADILVTVTIVGKTELADRVAESVEFQPSDTSKLTVGRFTEVYSITQDRLTGVNFEFFDGSGNHMAFLPNHMKEISCPVITVPDSDSSSSAFNILYKPLAPLFDSDGESVMDAYALPILYKCRELNKLDQMFKEDSSVFSGKAMGMLTSALQHDQPGKINKLNFGPNPFTSIYSGYV